VPQLLLVSNVPFQHPDEFRAGDRHLEPGQIGDSGTRTVDVGARPSRLPRSGISLSRPFLSRITRVGSSGVFHHSMAVTSQNVLAESDAFEEPMG
jgi:hypothetical protein